MSISSLFLISMLIVPKFSCAFVVPQNSQYQHSTRRGDSISLLPATQRLPSSFLDKERSTELYYNYGDTDGPSPSNINEQASLISNFKHRVSGLRWTKGSVKTKVCVRLEDDWVRRIDMDEYPLAVCGTKLGTLNLLNLEKGTIESTISNAHHASSPNQFNKFNKSIFKKLYGSMDGGGPIAMTICNKNGYIITSGREGGASVWNIVENDFNDSKDLLYVGRLSATKTTSREKNTENGDDETEEVSLDDVLITCLQFNKKGDKLYCGGHNGNLYIFDCASSSSSAVGLPKINTVITNKNNQFGTVSGPILDISINDESGCGVCAVAAPDGSTNRCGSIKLFNLSNGKFIDELPSLDYGAPMNTHPRSILLLTENHKKEETDDTSSGGITDIHNKNGSNNLEKSFSIICGGSDGSMHRIGLQNYKSETDEEETTNTKEDTTMIIDSENPFVLLDKKQMKMNRKHTGPVMGLISPQRGIFLSGGQDSTVRVWGTKEESCTSRTKKEETPQPEIRLPQCLYALTGYKLWLGSISTDGVRLISDGCENSVVMRDFSGEVVDI